jgi:hypothetical protein
MPLIGLLLGICVLPLILIASYKLIMKSKKDHKWRHLFITAVILNIMFFPLAAVGYLVSALAGPTLGLPVLICVLSVIIIDWIEILLYCLKEQPMGIAKIISYTALTVLSLMVVYIGFQSIQVIKDFIPGV